MNRSPRGVIRMLFGSIAALPLIASAAISAPATVTLDRCSWDHPGVNPFMGDVVAAVDRYRDIPPEVRERLKARMATREYDDLVEIRRDSMTGRGGYDYGSTITDMHFGTHQVCRSVTRSSWTPQMQERGLVYCESGHCILVPTVCRNVSRVTRRGVGPAMAENAPLLGDPAAAAPAAPLMADAPQALPEIDWDGPPGAGPLEAGPIGHADGVPALAGPGWGGAPDGGWYGLPVIVPGVVGGGGGPGGPTVTTVKPPLGPDGTPFPPAPPVITPVPEPGTWALMVAGLAAVALVRRRTAHKR
ncbi:MAG: MHFG family PEP-CTERM protein [Pseudomonadota bacterium]